MYKPENCKGVEQTFLIFQHLYCQYDWCQYKEQQQVNPALQAPPPSIFCFVEGLPGTGKSFVTKTISNITRKLHKRNNADMKSAPTGCAGALIGGSTHCRCNGIPTGKKFMAPPTAITTSKTDALNAMVATMCAIFTRLMDKHSMAGRPFWGWFKYRHEELRRPPSVVTVAAILPDSHSLKTEIYNRPWGGIPCIYSFGDSAQLPPVMMKALYDKTPGKQGSSDVAGRTAISEFLLPPDETEARSTVVIMDKVLRQDNADMLRTLGAMRNGNMKDVDVQFLLDRCIDILSPEEQLKFHNTYKTLHLVPRWNMTHKLIFEYLQEFTTPMAKIRAEYSSGQDNATNHCIKESSYPDRLAICVGSIVMLLKNFVVEQDILNGSIGIVREIVYKDAIGPKGDTIQFPAYEVVEFPYSKIPEDKKCFPDKPSTWIPIPVVTERCEKKCCSITTIPLRVCIAITIYKSQGMTIGEGEIFEYVVVYFPEEGRRNSAPGSELVAISRAKKPENLAIGNESLSLTIMRLMSIGKGKANDKRRAFEQELKGKAGPSQLYYINKIKDLDTNEIDNEKSFDGGCQFLLGWYNNKV